MKLYIKTPLIDLAGNDNADTNIMFKMEAYQPSGSFKLRGMDRICRMAIEDGVSHFISSSGGNAGLSVAYVGRKLGIRVTVVIPRTTPEFIIKKLEREDAEVIVHGDVWDEAHQYALSLVKDDKSVYIPPFDHPKLWDGHSTIVDELKEQCETQPDLIILSVGGGGLLCGVMEGLIRNQWQDTKVLAVETVGSASLYHAVKAGHSIILDKIDTIATSLGAKQVAARSLEYAHDYNIEPVLVSDESCARACVKFADDYRVLVEPACGASISLIYDNSNIIKGYKNIVVIVCGGSVINLKKILRWKAQYKIEGE